MTPEKIHDPQEPVAITLPWEDWQTVLHWIQYGSDYHTCKTHEVLGNCADKQLAGRMAREHQLEAENAKRLAKIIEAAMIPNPKDIY